MYLHAVDANESEHMRTGIECSDGLELIRITQFTTHEAHAIAVNGSHARQANVVGLFRPQPQHSLAFVAAKGAQVIDAFIRIGQQHGIGIQIELHIRLEL